MAQTLIVAGARACFRRPEIVNDVVTYDVITPVAARRLFETVHWTPAIRWQVERIDVLHPIRVEWDGGRGGERMLHLVDVRYVLHARFEMTGRSMADDHPGKHAEMFRRRARRGQFAQPPVLGRQGLPAEVRPAEGDEPLTSAYAGSGAIDLGWMVHDLGEAGEARGYRFYRPLMIDGTIDCRVGDPARVAD